MGFFTVCTCHRPLFGSKKDSTLTWSSVTFTAWSPDISRGMTTASDPESLLPNDKKTDG
jgi:hypothetical protein